MMDVNTCINEATENMELAIDYLEESLSHIRAGKANPKLHTDVPISIGLLTNLGNSSTKIFFLFSILTIAKSKYGCLIIFSFPGFLAISIMTL